PTLVGQMIGNKSVNFGCVNAGADVYVSDQTVLEACAGAKITVLQAMGAQNMSNRFYAVHPRRNDRFLRASALLKTIFGEVDFTEFNFTRHLLTALQSLSSERFSVVRRELREAWIARTRTMIQKIDGTVVLLWLADRSPEDESIQWGIGSDPLFVDRSMLAEMRPYVQEIVEVVPDATLKPEGTEGMVFSPLEEPAAKELLGLSAHRDAAEALAGPLTRLLGEGRLKATVKNGPPG
ncbi:MAG: DUF6473 family protein, partial [Halocynthiibacter sp.]